MPEFGLSEKSEYSMDFSLFYRIDTLFQKLNLATLSLDLYLWYNLILVLYKEIAPLINEKDRQQYKDKMNRLIPVFIEIKRQREFSESGSYNIPTELYVELQNLEISLRDEVNKKGIYLRKKEDLSYGIR